MDDSTSTTAVGEPDRPFQMKPGAQAIVGTSFKHEHLPAILAAGRKDGFFEVHAENYMGAGGPPHRVLSAIRKDYPLSIHGVCMSIGGPAALDLTHLARFHDPVAR